MRKLHYYWFRFCMWLARPAIAVLETVGGTLTKIPLVGRFFVPPLTREQYAIYWLFPNEYQAHFVLSLAQSETGQNFNSKLALRTNNIFNYGVTALSFLQRGVVGTPNSPEPDFGVYKDKLDSIYDFYYLTMCSKFRDTRGVAIMQSPSTPYGSSIAPTNYEGTPYTPENKGYVWGVLNQFRYGKQGPFFTSDLTNKYKLILQLEAASSLEFSPSYSSINLISIALCCGVFALYWYLVRPLSRLSKVGQMGKGKQSSALSVFN